MKAHGRAAFLNGRAEVAGFSTTTEEREKKSQVARTGKKTSASG